MRARMYFGVCVLCILGVSASLMQLSSPNEFQYRRTDICDIGYNIDCLPFDQDRCDYYKEAYTLLHEEDNDAEGLQDQQLRNDVDGIMFDIAEKATLADNIECIPYISRYTDCDKENICIGCQSCHCDSEGSWNCTTEMHCRKPEPAIDINHRVVVAIVKTLLCNEKSNRSKRSMTDRPVDMESTISPEELAEWFYGTDFLRREPLNIDDTSAINNMMTTGITFADITVATEPTYTTTTVEVTSTTESDYLAFDEVLKNIDNDSNYYTRKYPQLSLDNGPVDFDNMLFEDLTTKSDNDTIDNTTDISYIVNLVPEDYELTEPNLNDATKFVTQLLESEKTDDLLNDTEIMDMLENKNIIFGFDKSNNMAEYNAINLIKREASSIPLRTSNVTNVTSTIESKSTNVIIENTNDSYTNKSNLKMKVLLPLLKIINSQGKEVEDLKQVKKHLINFMNSNDQSPVIEILDYPNVSATNSLHDIEMFPDLAYDLRRTNPNIKKQFLYKLKADIYKVIGDIMNFKNYHQGYIADDLDILEAALRQYLHSGKATNTFETDAPTKFIRSHWEKQINKCTGATFKQCVIELFEIVDKAILKRNALGLLSPFPKIIIRNIARTHYFNDFNAIGLSVHDDKYNMMNNLITIGNKWVDIVKNIKDNSPLIALYRLKRLHLNLKLDIHKMKDALSFINFSHNRRIIPFLKNVPNKVIDQIDERLKATSAEVQSIVKDYSQKPEIDKDTLAFKFRSKIKLKKKDHDRTKHSFLRRIRTLFKSSRGDVNELLYQTVPKSEIVEQLNFKKLNHLAQKKYLHYEEIMKRWQNNLGVTLRYKRDLIDRLKGRIKNIIPKYLRHKVDPKLHEKRKTEKAKKKRPRHNKHKKTTLTTPTTKTKPTIRQFRTTRK